jgi:hypothetical protein
VQDHTAEEYEEAENQIERTRKDLADIKQVLEHIQAPQLQERGVETIPRVTKVGEKTA